MKKVLAAIVLTGSLFAFCGANEAPKSPEPVPAPEETKTITEEVVEVAEVEAPDTKE
jgi:hypothetical protein